jgi:hypothetical protein
LALGVTHTIHLIDDHRFQVMSIQCAAKGQLFQKIAMTVLRLVKAA